MFFLQNSTIYSQNVGLNMLQYPIILYHVSIYHTIHVLPYPIPSYYSPILSAAYQEKSLLIVNSYRLILRTEIPNILIHTNYSDPPPPHTNTYRHSSSIECLRRHQYRCFWKSPISVIPPKSLYNRCWCFPYWSKKTPILVSAQTL